MTTKRVKWIDAWYPVILDRAILPQVPQLVEKRNGEFCVSLEMEPSLIADICYHGYMPMGEMVSARPLLLIKSHQQRCVLDFHNLHISRKLKRHARGLTVLVNHNFSQCLEKIVRHHPQLWLIQPLCEALNCLHRQAIAGIGFHSIEVYEGEHLVAGEIGYTTGSIYSSLAGFHNRDGAGSVQLAILGLLLIKSGFSFWDLGMEVPYKLSLGAHLVNRKEFLQRWSNHRHESTPIWAASRLDTEQIITSFQRVK